jgi:hypothetical protein
LQQVEAEVLNTEYTEVVTMELAVPAPKELEFLNIINELFLLKTDIRKQ